MPIKINSSLTLWWKFSTSHRLVKYFYWDFFSIWLKNSGKCHLYRWLFNQIFVYGMWNVNGRWKASIESTWICQVIFHILHVDKNSQKKNILSSSNWFSENLIFESTRAWASTWSHVKDDWKAQNSGRQQKKNSHKCERGFLNFWAGKKICFLVNWDNRILSPSDFQVFLMLS